jgi:hypothetical protein
MTGQNAVVHHLTFREPIRGAVEAVLEGGALSIYNTSGSTNSITNEFLTLPAFLVDIGVNNLQTPNYVNGNVRNYIGVIWNKSMNNFNAIYPSSTAINFAGTSFTNGKCSIHLTEGLDIRDIDVAIYNSDGTQLYIPEGCSCKCTLQIRIKIGLTDS